MDPWTIGLVALIVVGVAVIAYGALADRRKNRRAARELLSPPNREIPRFSPNAPAPQYLTELQARRAPADAPTTALDDDERTAIRAALTDPSTVTVPVGHLGADFITDTVSGWAVLERPVVLVCPDEVTTMRELLGVLEKHVLSGTAIALVATRFADDVLATLAVNRVQRKIGVVAVAASGDHLTAIAEATHALPVARADRQSGYIPESSLGRCARWVSSSTTTYVLSGSA